MLAPKNAHPEAWADFKAGPWEETIDVRDFIQRNYTPYTGDGSFRHQPPKPPRGCGPR
ncbi:hypothetical protein V8H18_07910 [Lautropia mirabilis]